MSEIYQCYTVKKPVEFNKSLPFSLFLSLKNLKNTPTNIALVQRISFQSVQTFMFYHWTV